MVEVVKEGFLNEDIRERKSSRMFPEDEYERILSAVEDAPDSVFETDQRTLDSHVADAIPDYYFEEDAASGRNSKCKLWTPDFDHSVDLYHPEERIAIEIEKSQQKRVSDDILKFVKGGKTQRNNRKKVEFGCLIVPVNWGSKNNNLYNEAMQCMRFIRSVLHVEDIAVIGYRIQ
ncbi:hypothetical protein SAMN04487947_1500 [Halogeometricum rufum]|uniref:Uncharacterized protein n=1 Tax=Halogeometricum rufum TaxID=553469 RepID=A0A1I6GPY8_9EURY|nr:hypothetical protein [Halogeometricum rufum]SFR44293.1 hypothetical protein SAMN04487947_1500 [Halogeometricum rufum]